MKVRRLDVSEGALLRAVRIGALQDSPEAFGETLGGALECSDEQWASLATVTFRPRVCE